MLSLGRGNLEQRVDNPEWRADFSSVENAIDFDLDAECTQGEHFQTVYSWTHHTGNIFFLKKKKKKDIAELAEQRMEIQAETISWSRMWLLAKLKDFVDV